MRHELFIDNKKVDLSPNTNINLTYKSNLLSELDKITSSYSYTIKLPKTKRNMELIEGCNIPSNDSSFAYLQHRARLLRDGIEIVRDAVVVLLSVGDDIQISLTWGNVSALATFLTSDAMLRELDLGIMKWYAAEYAPNSLRADYGNGGAFNMPSPKVKTIVEEIFNEAGILYETPNEQGIYNSLRIPAINVPEQGTQSEDIVLENNSYETSWNAGGLKFKTSQDSNMLDFVWDTGLYRKGFRTKSKYYTLKITVKLYVDYKNKYATVDNPTIQDADGYINESPINYGQSGETKTTYFYFEKEFTAGEYSKSYLFLYVRGIQLSQTLLTIRDLEINVHVENPLTFTYPVDGNPVDIVLSDFMPEISQIDFMKGIMAMMGWYAEPMEGDIGVRLLPYSTISDNKSEAIDWSDKIVNRKIEPSEIEFRMDDMAQKNYFRYAEDDTVTGDYDSYITVDDKTLEASRDAVTLPFAATDTVNGLPYIPLFSVNDDGSLEVNDITPRILDLDYGSTLKFDGLQWNKLIQANWQAYQDIIRRPKVITEQVRLNAIDLKQIDMTIPVYISQYGSYFAVLEIKTKNDDICDVQLLKI